MADEGGIHQEFSGDVSGNFIQAGHVGQIVVNESAPKVSVADEIPSSVEHYINYEPQLDAITRVARPEQGGHGVFVVEILGQALSGKSEIAHQWAKRHKAQFPGGRFYAQLGPGVDLYSVLARWLRYRGYPLDRLPATLGELGGFWRSETAGQQVLIMLDGACSEDIELLLPGGDGSAVLLIPLPGAELRQFRARHSAAKPVRLTPLTIEQGLALLAHRLDEGREDDGRVAQEPGAASRLIEICHQSPGVLNIAAGMLVVDEESLIDELVERLERDGVTTPLGLTVIFDAAYDALDERAQRVYRAFGAHPGDQLPITKEAVTAALGLAIGEVEQALDALSQASLIRRSGRRAHSLSSQVAEHAEHKAGDELPALRAAFVAYYRDHGLRCAETLKPGRGWTEQVIPLEDYEQAQRWLVDNETAIGAAAQVADPASVVRLCLVTWPIYQRGGYPAKMVELNKLGVEAATTDNEPMLSVMLTQLAFAYRQQRKFDLAVQTLERARTIGSAEARQSALEGIGLVRRDQNLIPEAQAALDENLFAAQQIQNHDADPANSASLRRRVAMARFHRATVLDPAAAIPELTAVREQFQAEPENLVKIDLWLGGKLRRTGDLAQARQVLTGAVEPAQRHNMQRELGLLHLELADAEPDHAEQHLRTALRILQFGYEADAERVRARLTELGLPV